MGKVTQEKFYLSDTPLQYHCAFIIYHFGSEYIHVVIFIILLIAPAGYYEKVLRRFR